MVALALVKGRVDVAALYDEPLDDPRVLALAAKTFCPPDPESDYPKHFPGEVRITLRDGRRLVRREPVSRGAPERPLTPAEIEAKFFLNATRAIPDVQAKRITEMVWNIETLPAVGALVAECVARD
ncbi:MAG: hypothetical protein A2X50_09255 [Candidatus Rokubacteria bacterium GWF2_70_14]|nr:MAG: hypothetical protein A2X50_09255 [Candidatus Rokubacteria bacterium GWF2_70_14]